MAIQLLKVNKRDFGRFLNLANDFLSEVVEVFFRIHKLLQIDHRVEVSDNKQFILATADVDIDFVHGNVLGVATVCVSLHLRVVIFHLIGWYIEREWGTFLDMV